MKEKTLKIIFTKGIKITREQGVYAFLGRQGQTSSPKSQANSGKARNKPLIVKILMPVLPQQDNCELNILFLDTVVWSSGVQLCIWNSSEIHYRFNTDASITATVQTVQHRNATTFTPFKQLAALTPLHMRHFKPNESQIPIFTASPNLPWQLLQLWPVAEKMKTSAWQFSPQRLCVNGSVHTQSLLFTSEPGRKVFFWINEYCWVDERT